MTPEYITSTFPKVSLGFFPTPVLRLNNLEKVLGGPRILMKRDDQTGLGFGGNKTRKLEFLFGEALEQECTSVITAGAEQSNHCRQTAAAAASCGISCHLALGGDPPTLLRGNLLLDYLFGATIHWSGKLRKGENIKEIWDELHQKGERPYIIPYGGSNEAGALGFIHALIELENQLRHVSERVDHIIFASSSGGTHSGLLVGRDLLQCHYSLIGINIDKDEVYGQKLEDYILTLADATSQLLKHDHHFSKNDIILNDDYLGDGYGVIGKAEKEAISLVAHHEGILLDPVYTGRAMAGLIDLIRKKTFSPDETVLFWHTGGSPAIFAYEDSLQPSPVT